MGEGGDGVMAKLGEICSLKAGKFVSANNIFSEYKQGLYPCFGGNGIRGYVSDYTHDGEFPLIGRQGALCGNINLASGKFHATEHAVVVQPKISMNIHWLYYALIAMNLGQYATGAAQPGLAVSKLETLTIAVPSRPTQDKVEKSLSQIEKLLSLRKQQLAKLDELVKARFVEMFGDCHHNPKGWQTKTVEDIAFVGSSKRVFVEELQTDGIPFYRGTEVGALAEKKAINPELFITEEHYNQLCTMSGKPQKGDLLMPSICPDGRIWIVDTDAPFYFKDGRVLWIHLTSADYNSVFLLYTLKDRIMTDYDSIASGTTFAELKIFSLKKCRVFDAPLSLQNDFAAFVERVDQQKQTIQQSLEKLELMKKALMQEYFG